MEIELTSSRDDGSFTWRAAGAKEPRGSVEASLIGSGRRVGDVLRVEADVELDGITIISVLPSKERSREPELIQIMATPSDAVAGVTTTLVERSERKGRNRRSFLDEASDEGRDRRPRRPVRPRTAPADTSPAPGGDRPASRSERPARPRTDRPAGPRPQPDTRPARPPRSNQPSPRAPESRPERSAARPRPPRLVPTNVHRDALLESLPAEQRAVAEQLATGGLPAVRRAVADEQTAAASAGRAAVNADAIIALAEQLLAGVREATWLDRAEAAVAMLETISLRDLRASVAGAAPRDGHGRELQHQLRQALDERLKSLRENWEKEIAHALEEKRVLHALRLSARPAEPSARFPASLVEPLADAAGSALAPTVQLDRWLALLEAAAASPVRRLIKPVGIPEDSTGAARQAATIAAGRIPALSKLLGLPMPPPPRPMPRPSKPQGRPAPQRVAPSSPGADSLGQEGRDTAPATEPAQTSVNQVAHDVRETPQPPGGANERTTAAEESQKSPAPDGAETLSAAPNQSALLEVAQVSVDDKDAASIEPEPPGRVGADEPRARVEDGASQDGPPQAFPDPAQS